MPSLCRALLKIQWQIKQKRPVASWSLYSNKGHRQWTKKEWVDNVISDSNKYHQDINMLHKAVDNNAFGDLFLLQQSPCHCSFLWATLAVLSFSSSLCGGEVRGVDLLFGKWDSREQKTFYLFFLLFSIRRKRAVGVEFGMVDGHCLLITMVICMHFLFFFLELTMLFWCFIYAPPFSGVVLCSCFSQSTLEIFFLFNLTFTILDKHCLPFLEPSSMTLHPMQNWLLSPSLGVSIIPLDYFCWHCHTIL